MARKTYDQMAVDILLSGGSKESRDRQLSTLAQAARDHLENRVACPECGDKGPHEDNGCTGSLRELCCTNCGNHFEA